MTLQDFEQAFVLLLSVCTEKDGSVKWKDEYGDDIFIVFPTLSPNKAIVRQYYTNRNKQWEMEYIKGLLHGKYFGWYKNGNKSMEAEYVKGLLHGKSVGWLENGNKSWEAEYIKGLRHGKYLSWYENGNKKREAEYINGLLVRIIK